MLLYVSKKDITYRGVGMSEKDIIKKEIKQLLKGYKKMDKKTRLRLIQLGFIIDSDGKHHKITHTSNTEKMVVLGKTVSDSRSGRNTANQLCSML